MNKKDRTVYIMLTDYPDRVSRAIKRIGFWEYSHVSISTEKHFPRFFSFTGKRGFMTEDFDLHPTYKGIDVPCALFALPVTETELENVERIIARLKNNADRYKYSYIGLALLYLRIIPKQRRSDTCVGFVSRTIREQTSLSAGCRKKFCSPNDIKTFFRNELVFEGTLRRLLKKARI
ncbi:MAG: hypothetical protein ACI4I0_00205 [Acutalibacteraceae bacterium]